MLDQSNILPACCAPTRPGFSKQNPFQNPLCLALLRLLGEGSSVRVQAKENLAVLKRVLLLDSRAASGRVTLGGGDGALDFGRVDETGEIGLRDAVGGEEEVALVGGDLSGGAVDLVEGLEGSGRPDDEASEVTTRGELEEVEGGDGAGLDTGDVTESLDEVLAIDGRVVDDEGTTALAVTAATELTLTGAELLGALDLGNVLASTDSGEKSDRAGSLGSGTGLEDSRVDDERDLSDGHDLVATGHQERSGSGSGQSRAGSVTPDFVSTEFQFLLESLLTSASG